MLENRTEPMQEHTWWRLHCASCLLVFCAVVWCCWCWLRSEWWKKKSKPIHILTALFTTGIHKEYKQVLPYRPTSWKPWPTSSTVRVSVTTFKNRTGSMQEQIWSKLHCASCLVSEGKKNIQTYPYSNCTFHHKSSQRKQTSVKVPANLGKTCICELKKIIFYLLVCLSNLYVW